MIYFTLGIACFVIFLIFVFIPNEKINLETNEKINLETKKSSPFFEIYNCLKVFNGQRELQIAKELVQKYNITSGKLFSKVEKYTHFDDFSMSMAGGYIDKNIQYSIALLENDILIMETYYLIEDEFDGSTETYEKLTRIVEISLKQLLY